MTRHAKNATASSVYTYHEKKKDAKASGYGTDSMRLAKESIRDFDSCCLTLQPCRNPVVTKEGYLYDKEAIITFIIEKKNEYSRRMRAYQAQQNKEQLEKEEVEMGKIIATREKFLRKEENIASSSKSNDSSSISNMSNGKDKHLPSFWIPAMTPQSKKSSLPKPDKNIYCPMSGQLIKLKELIPVVFTLVNDPDDKLSLIKKQNRYMCAVTHDILSNSVPCVVMKPSGHVITAECYELLIKKDMVCPLTGKKLKDSDIIYLQRGGTGFSSVNSKLDAKLGRPVLQA